MQTSNQSFPSDFANKFRTFNSSKTEKWVLSLILGSHPRFGKGSKKNGKIVPLIRETNFTLGPIQKSLYLLLLYQFHLPKIGQNLIAGHWDQYITLH